MNEDIIGSLSMLEKKKLLMRQNVNDSSEKVLEKLMEILQGMDRYKKFYFEKKSFPMINETYIERKIGNLDKTVGGVFDEYVKSMILQTVKVVF